MVTLSARKRLESIERVVIPAMFVGVLSKDNKWLKRTLEEALPKLEARALHLAQECRKAGECKENDALCDEARISAMFKETRIKLEKENVVRKSRSRYHH
ncbi:MAG: hypothetical protein KKI06_05840 [Euryarchaeota archaeon]|nr:hypothetical protein [Euryarchaeota archaeon]MBU4223438.1 hypothetical protein [Euryarchaeota archaeon]MCG2734824.1 hypothetical protein [Candidatus Methanoperedenaceae archaeon]